MIEFVTASHNRHVLFANLWKSPIFNAHQLKVAWNYNNIPQAYNLHTNSNNVTCYIHHDVFLPDSFKQDLLKSLEQVPKDWGVLGVAGVRMGRGKEIHGYILDRSRVWGRPIQEAVEVDTLDELLLITRGDITFDEQFPLDFYGADICLQAKFRGLKSYVINAFCHHNSTRKIGERTPSFYESQRLFALKWEDQLPVVTTCANVEKC